MLYGLIALY